MYDSVPLPYDLKANIIERAAHIQLAIFDVDGVLTDGKLYYTEHGEQLKVFHALDGLGLKLLQQAGVMVSIITARDSAPLRQRMDDLGIKHAFYGVKNKLATFKQLINEYNINAQHCCYLADDIIDLEVMRECGLKFAVKNAHYRVQHYADWTTPQMGGNGAARAICDIILHAQNTRPCLNL